MDDLYEFEERIYKLDYRDWHWEVRHEGLLSRPFASGRVDTRREAKAAVQTAIENELRKLRAPWQSVAADSGTEPT